MKKGKSIWQRHSVRSGLEKRLKEWLEKEKIKYQYEPHSFNYVTKHKYTPDFLVNNLYIECKGRLTTEDRVKLLAVRDANPGIALRILFQRDQPIRKGSKTLYSEWATKNNFIFAFVKDEKIPEIPKEWLNE